MIDTQINIKYKMSDNNGEKLMKFGPEWLRNNLSKDNSSNLQNISTANAKVRAAVKHKVPEFRYKREELLSFYDGKRGPPDELKQFKLIYVNKPQLPIALQFYPRRVRAKRPINPRLDFVPNIDSRPPRPSCYRDFNRPLNNFQPRWSNEHSWRHHANRNLELEDNWRSNRYNEYPRNRWIDKGKDRRENQDYNINEPYPDDRNSPDDNLPEWANNEDGVDETGTFDSTGAFLPIVSEDKFEENDLEVSPNIEIESIPDVQAENITTSCLDEEVQVILEENYPKEIEITDPTEKLCSELNNLKLDINDREDAKYFHMVEDYLIKLVQEDEKEVENMDLLNHSEYLKPHIPREVTSSLMNQMEFNMHSHPTAIYADYKDHGWYYQDNQNTIRGPFSSNDMLELYNAGCLDSFFLIRKGNSSQFVLLTRLFELCGGEIPFLIPDHITNNFFAKNNPAPYIPSGVRHIFPEPREPPPMKDYLNNSSILLEHFNANSRDINHSASLNNINTEDQMQMPLNQPPVQLSNLSSHIFHHPTRMENSLPFPFSPFSNPNSDILSASTLPMSLENNIHNNWTGINQHNMPWVDTSHPPKLSPYVPIPMPTGSHSVSFSNQEIPGLSRLQLPNLNTLPPIPMPGETIPISVNQPIFPPPNSTLLNDQMKDPVEDFDYPSSVLMAPKMNTKIDYQQIDPIMDPQKVTPVFFTGYPLYENDVLPYPYSIRDELFENDVEQQRNDNEKFTQVEPPKRKSRDGHHKSSETKKKSEEHESIKTERENKIKDADVLKVTYKDTNEKLHPEMLLLQQKNKNYQQAPLPLTCPWNIKENNQNIESFLDQFRTFDKKLTPQVMNKRRANDPVPQNTAIIKEKFTWANKNIQPLEVMSFTDIQAEEQKHHMKLERHAPVPRPIAQTNQHQNIWSNSGSGNLVCVEGFWDTEVNRSKSNDNFEPSLNNIQPPTVKIQQNQQKIEKGAKPKVSIPKKETAEMKPLEKSVVNDQHKFINWAKSELNSKSEVIDVHEFVTFLCTLENPFEIEEYAKFYLGDTKYSNDFSKLFVQKRSQMFSKSRSIPCDDLCSPAPAFNPSIDKRDESKKKNKKKNRKMSKVDSRILGFNATASENRFNIGNIDVV